MTTAEQPVERSVPKPVFTDAEAGAKVFPDSTARNYNYFVPQKRKQTHYEDVTVEARIDTTTVTAVTTASSTFRPTTGRPVAIAYSSSLLAANSRDAASRDDESQQAYAFLLRAGPTRIRGGNRAA